MTVPSVLITMPMLRRYLRDDLTVLDFCRPYSAIMRFSSSTGTSVMRLYVLVIIFFLFKRLSDGEVHAQYVMHNPVGYTSPYRWLRKEEVSDIFTMLSKSPSTLVAGNCIFYKTLQFKASNLFCRHVKLTEHTMPLLQSRAANR